MNIDKHKILSFLRKGNERTIRAKKNIIVSFICKVLTLLIGFIIVPITLGYVGKVEYGIWLTISSIISWFSFFDIGLGNGLRNKLVEALANDDIITARIYVSSTYALIIVIATILFLVFFLSAYFIPWNKVLNTNEIMNAELFKIVVVVFFFFCLGFVVQVLSSILQAMQRYAINDILAVISQLLGLAAIIILTKTTNGSLFNLCLFYGSKTAVVLLIASFIIFSNSLKELRPQRSYVNIRKAFPLMKLGFWFFINQILYLVVSQSSVFLVIQFFGPEDVTVFNLAYKYMTIVTMLYIMFLTPFLSAFTEAYTKKEFNWIKTTIKSIRYIWVICSLGIIVSVLLYRWFFHLWVGNQIEVPLSLIVVLAVSSIVGTLSSTHTLFLNGIGKVRLQFYVQILQAIFFIPLAYLFYTLNLGLSSLIIPGVIFGIVSSFVFISQYNKIIMQKATGIWIK